jgi:iron complex transport system ATP-binding protein
MVTHHVEEIPPGCTHVMMLRDGRVVAQGLLDDVMTSENLSETFDQPLELLSRRRRFTAWRK